MTPSRSVYGAFSVPAEEGEYAPERVTFAPPFPALIGYNAADYTVRTVGVTVIAPDASAPPVLDVWLLDPDADPAEDASWTLWPGAIDPSARRRPGAPRYARRRPTPRAELWHPRPARGARAILGGLPAVV